MGRKKLKKEPLINPAFVEELEFILGKIKENVCELNHNDLKKLKEFTNPKEYHYPCL